MTTVREPLLRTVAILDLRPTQMTVGMREVKAKRKRWRDESKKKGEEFLGKHLIPVILGPKHRHYIIDHHHLARALHDEGVKEVAVTDVANLSALDQDSFWFVMENRDWTHTFVMAVAGLTATCRSRWISSSTIRSAHSRVNCAA